MNAADRLTTAIHNADPTYNATAVAALIALQLLSEHRLGRRDPWEGVREEFYRFGMPSPHPNTCRAIVRDVSGLVDAVTRYTDTFTEAT